MQAKTATARRSAIFPQGSFSATYFEGCDAQEAVCNELGSFSPTELLLGGNEENIREIRGVATPTRLGCCMGRSREHQFDLSLCKAAVESQFEKTQEALGLSGHDEVVIAAGALLCALRDAQKNELPHIRALDFYVAGKFMGLDLTARRNLELTETMRSKEKKGSLLGVLDQTKTAMGGRLLRSWMERPLLSPSKIGRRLAATQELVDKTIDREELRLSLREVSDYERVMARIVTRHGKLPGSGLSGAGRVDASGDSRPAAYADGAPAAGDLCAARSPAGFESAH